MNKVYKVVWSKVRNAYVVVSELAKNHGKSKSVRTAIVRGVLAAAIAGMPVSGLAALPQPNQPLVNSENATGTGSVAVGQNTTASGAQSTAMGNGTKAEGANSTAMGQNTTAHGTTSTAMGQSTTAKGNYSMQWVSEARRQGIIPRQWEQIPKHWNRLADNIELLAIIRFPHPRGHPHNLLRSNRGKV